MIWLAARHVTRGARPQPPNKYQNLAQSVLWAKVNTTSTVKPQFQIQTYPQVCVFDLGMCLLSNTIHLVACDPCQGFMLLEAMSCDGLSVHVTGFVFMWLYGWCLVADNPSCFQGLVKQQLLLKHLLLWIGMRLTVSGEIPYLHHQKMN